MSVKRTGLGSAAQAELLETLEPLSDSDDYEGFELVGRDGVVLSASVADQVGRRLTEEGMIILGRLLQGETVLTAPCEQGGAADLTGLRQEPQRAGLRVDVCDPAQLP